MKEDPSAVMEPWRLVLLALYAILVMPMALAAGALLIPVTRCWAKTDRVACRNCGYRMPVIERHCPECRAMWRAEDA